MALHTDILNGLNGFSKAAYSTWFEYGPGRFLLDCGEGVSSTMGNFVFGIEDVFVSHGHYDHIGGIAGMVLARAFARGDKEKPLTIHYPAGWTEIEALKVFIQTVGPRGFPLTWSVSEPGKDIPLKMGGGKHFIRPFQVNHSRKGMCLGYSLIEKRTRLCNHYVGLPKDELAILAKTGPLSETYEKQLLVYSGDSAPLDHRKILNAEVLIHEATFAEESDRDGQSHSSIREVIDVAKNAGVNALILYHLSGRYFDTVEQKTRKIVKEMKYGNPVGLFVGRKLIQIQ